MLTHFILIDCFERELRKHCLKIQKIIFFVLKYSVHKRLSFLHVIASADPLVRPMEAIVKSYKEQAFAIVKKRNLSSKSY